MTTCTKNVNGPCENEATEFLWVRGLWDGEWESHPRCAGHPAADDVAMIRRMYADGRDQGRDRGHGDRPAPPRRGHSRCVRGLPSCR